MNPWTLATVAGAALAWIALRSAQAREVNDARPLVDEELGAPLWGPLEDEESDVPPMSPGEVFDANDARARAGNLRAFLDSIAVFESEPGPNGYRRLYSDTRAPVYFDSFDLHPAAGGWPGVRLPDAQCIAAGYSPGCVSTAAGRYQVTFSTYRRLAPRLGVSDFSPATQDALAVELIKEKGALEYVETGRIGEALARLRRVWASMPAAGYEQREHDVAKWLQAYANAGGVLV